jgi:hypothetical protein
VATLLAPMVWIALNAARRAGIKAYSAPLKYQPVTATMIIDT